MLCNSTLGVEEAYNAGALGLIYQTDRGDDVPFVVPMPALALQNGSFTEVVSYLAPTRQVLLKYALTFDKLNFSHHLSFASSNYAKSFSLSLQSP